MHARDRLTALRIPVQAEGAEPQTDNLDDLGFESNAFEALEHDFQQVLTLTQTLTLSA